MAYPTPSNQLPQGVYALAPLETSESRPLANGGFLPPSAERSDRHGRPVETVVDEFHMHLPAILEGSCEQTLHDHVARARAAVHFDNPNNFLPDSNIQLLEVDSRHKDLSPANDSRLAEVLNREAEGVAGDGRRLLVFFAILEPRPKTSFGSRTNLSMDAAHKMISTFNLDPSLIANMLGRPDHWAPRIHHRFKKDGEARGFGLSLQHPRWDLRARGPPVSIVMDYNAVLNRTIYIISHRPNDTSDNALFNILKTMLSSENWPQCAQSLLADPLELHVLMCSLSFEASKYHVQAFEKLMWPLFKKVDKHFDKFHGHDRSNLNELTKELQVVAYNSDSHIMNAYISQLNANAVTNAYAELDHFPAFNRTADAFTQSRTRNLDIARYVSASMAKQERWFESYKSRKDTTMNLVQNLVTQQDAANNIQLAIEMRRDSCSMSTIAVMGIFFLPGTFMSTLLSSNIFVGLGSDEVNFKYSTVSLVWIVASVILTTLVLMLWKRHQKNQLAGMYRARRVGHEIVDTAIGHAPEANEEREVSSASVWDGALIFLHPARRLVAWTASKATGGGGRGGGGGSSEGQSQDGSDKDEERGSPSPAHGHRRNALG